MNAIAQTYCAYLTRSKLTIPVYLFTKSEYEPNEPKIFVLCGESGCELISEDRFPSYEATASRERIEIIEQRKVVVDELSEGRIAPRYSY